MRKGRSRTSVFEDRLQLSASVISNVISLGYTGALHLSVESNIPTRREMSLNQRELDILKNKLPRQKMERANILLKLDVEFNFNRTALAEFLESQELLGYSRASLYKLLGNPVLNSEEYRVLERICVKIGQSDLLPLIVSRGVARQFLTGSLGT